jgi:hypothetical protein
MKYRFLLIAAVVCGILLFTGCPEGGSASSGETALRYLGVSPGEISPAFDPEAETGDYTASVENTVEAVTVTAIPRDDRASVSENSGVPQPLAAGENPFEITVTAENGGQRVYKVTVSRALPGVPLITRITGGNKQLTVSWTAIPGAAGYDLYLSTANEAPGPETEPAKTVTGGNTLSAVLADLADGTEYLVWIRAEKDGEKSPWSAAGEAGTTLRGEKELLLFKIGNTEGVKDGGRFTVTLPYDAEDFTTSWEASPGATVIPKSVESFTGALVYTVRAENGEEQDYTVEVRREGRGGVSLEIPDEGDAALILGSPGNPILLSRTGDPQSVTVNAGTKYIRWAWYVDAGPDALGTGSSVTLRAGAYPAGTHYLTVIVTTAEEKIYSQEIVFKVLENQE